MEEFVTSSFRLGIAGGGQLGRMLALKAAEWDIRTQCLDPNENAPARIICDHYYKGSLSSYDDVVSFGEKVDLLTIESDNVNADALEYLEKQGKVVYPHASTLRIIQDKGLQRRFCEDNDLPVPDFKVFESKADFLNWSSAQDWSFPYIVKTRTAGYDGKGVFLVKSAADFELLPEVPLLAEKKVEMQKELTVIAVRNAKGETASYPLIELFLSSSGYLVDSLIAPASVSDAVEKQAQEIARKLVTALDIKGLLAIELFLDKSGNLLINECSPRPHNSGHQTIEGSFTSQYEQHLRGILNLPLGSCDTKILAGMINLLGEESATGGARYQGLSECLALPGVKIHIYGKKEVSPNRKMGHITVLNHSEEELRKIMSQVKERVKVSA